MSVADAVSRFKEQAGSPVNRENQRFSSDIIQKLQKVADLRPCEVNEQSNALQFAMRS